MNMFTSAGISLTSTLHHVRGASKLLRSILFWTFVAPLKKKKSASAEALFKQMVFMGIKSIVIVFFVAIFTGVVLAMQSAYQLEKMGATIYVASLVAISLCRELGPVLTALVVAARCGSSITAEIGTMQVTEQIQALDIMGINPIRYLAVPKFMGLLLMLPLLTILADFAGIFGGFLIGTTNLNLNPSLYMQTTYKFLELKDVYTGILKSFVFAALIGLIGCYWGFYTKGGAEQVGRSTTISVVTSFVLIIVSDSILTAIFFFSKV